MKAAATSSENLAARARGHLWLVGLGYLVFVVYGSLVPLHFRAMPMDAAIAAFRQIPWLQLGIGSRADWVANLLLFIPLAFIFTGALAHGRGLFARLLASVLILAAAVALSLGIEFTQLFFPQRTVSQNDIAAEALGGLLGVVVWWSAGARCLGWYESWLQVREPAALSERLIWGYLAFVFAYNVLPLDLTISAVEVFHKWREGKLILIPFSGLPAEPAYALYEVITDALIWLPPAFLWRFRGGRSTARAWWLGTATALLLEVLQLFVYSRVSDVTDLFTAALGAWVGTMLGARLGRSVGPSRAGTNSPGFGALLPLILALGWVLVLMALFWYPFDFRTDGAFIRERMEFLNRVPFEVYYYGTEYRAITEVFHKTLFFAPLGVLLAWFVVGLPWMWRGYVAAASILAILVTALGIELGQVMLAGKFPDTTDWFLECAGGLMGYLLFRVVRARLLPAPRKRTVDALARRHRKREDEHASRQSQPSG
jgi:glycopeptide antibiotics resistance protein